MDCSHESRVPTIPDAGAGRLPGRAAKASEPLSGPGAGADPYAGISPRAKLECVGELVELSAEMVEHLRLDLAVERRALDSFRGQLATLDEEGRRELRRLVREVRRVAIVAGRIRREARDAAGRERGSGGGSPPP